MGITRRSATALLTVSAFWLALSWPYRARAQTQPPPQQPQAAQPGDDTLAQAKQHFEAGKNAYNAGDYPTAIREFKAAEALRPSPILDYNIGLANEKLGKKRVAVKYYKRYLENSPSASNRAQVEASIAQLEAEIAAQPPPGPQAPPQQVEQPADNPPPLSPNQPPTYSSYDPYAATPPPYQAQPPQPQKKKSYWWVALIVVGGAALLVGIVVYAVLVLNASTTPVVADHAIREPPSPNNPSQRSPGVGPSIFSF